MFNKMFGNGIVALVVLLLFLGAMIAGAYAFPTTLGAFLVGSLALFLLAQIPYRQALADLRAHFKTQERS